VAYRCVVNQIYIETYEGKGEHHSMKCDGQRAQADLDPINTS